MYKSILNFRLKIIVLFVLIQSFAFKTHAQRIVYKSDSINKCVKKEIDLKSKNTTLVDETNSEVVILSHNYYPFATNIGSPIEFVRTVSDFHIVPSTTYYFSKQDSTLKYFEMKWDVQNSLDIFKPSFIHDSKRALTKECAKKVQYKTFYNQLNSKISSLFGQPTKRINTKKWEAYNTDGWRYEWKYDNYIIITELRLPKDGNINLIYITYSIAWK